MQVIVGAIALAVWAALALLIGSAGVRRLTQAKARRRFHGGQLPWWYISGQPDLPRDTEPEPDPETR